MMIPKRHMTAKEAAKTLGVSTTTLYAYVSRGLIRSEATYDDPRKRLYRTEDVQRLVDRKAQRRDPAQVVAETMHWGAPILESALTLITENGLYYRGQDACVLARNHTFEDVAALLWTESISNRAALFGKPTLSGPSASPLIARIKELITRTSTPIAAMQMALALVAEYDLAAYHLTPEKVIETGVHLLRILTYTLTRIERFNQPIAVLLGEAWGVGWVMVLDAALILCADHELNASAFAARVVASTEATPYAVVAGGLAALQGVRHGGYTRRVTSLLRDIEREGSASLVVGKRLEQGDSIPGFGHPLYPNGDPRAAMLLDLLTRTHPGDRRLEFTVGITHTVQRMTGEAPTIDFALAAMEYALRLPTDSALAIFALGRTAGWMAHAIEQYSTNQLIRPRAKYIGKLPGDGEETPSP